MPFTLGFQLLNRAGLTKGECDSPLPFLAKMNGIGSNSHYFLQEKCIDSMDGAYEE